MAHEAIGTVVRYVDEHGRPHDALLTAVHGETLGVHAVNLVYVSEDEAKHDPFGRQIERASSVAAQNEHSAHGRYYTVPE